MITVTKNASKKLGILILLILEYRAERFEASCPVRIGQLNEMIFSRRNRGSVALMVLN
jgi:hypothetical protein